MDTIIKDMNLLCKKYSEAQIRYQELSENLERSIELHSQTNQECTHKYPECPIMSPDNIILVESALALKVVCDIEHVLFEITALMITNSFDNKIYEALREVAKEMKIHWKKFNDEDLKRILAISKHVPKEIN